MKLVISFSIFFFVLEIMIRATSVDIDLLKNTLFYVPSDPQFFYASDNAKLLNDIEPNRRMVGLAGPLHPKELPGYTRTITTDQYGYRYSPWDHEKNPRNFRIAVVGGSNTWGASVSDEDTFSIQLAKFLNSKSVGKFEVWNGGINAAMLSQKIEKARYIVKDLKPDLLIIKHFHNRGRRAFNATQENLDRAIDEIKQKKYFDKNPELYEENVPFLFNQIPVVDEVHYRLVKSVAVYRLIHILINNYFVKLTFPNYEYADCNSGESLCSRIVNKYASHADVISERYLDEFKSENPNLAIVMFDPMSRFNCDTQKPKKFHDLHVISLCRLDLPDEYRNIHPPSYVYKYYGEAVGSRLIELDLLKKPI